MKKGTIIILVLISIILFSNTIFARTLSFTKVGEWGSGKYTDIRIHGNYAYCLGNGSGLDIINISVPTTPVKVGNYTGNYEMSTIEINGKYAYVGLSNSDISIIDIENPTAPIKVGTFSTSLPVNCIFFVDKIMYIVTNGYNKSSGFNYGKLIILDASNPIALTLMGSIDTSFGGNDLYVEGNYAVVVSGMWNQILYYIRGAIDIIDISNPTSPKMESSYTALLVTGVVVRENYVYFTEKEGGFYYGGLKILDISNPGAPVGVHSTTVITGYSGLECSGDYIYCRNNSGDCDVYNISDPINPEWISSFSTSGAFNGLAFSDNYAYVSDGDSGLQVFDISIPNAIQSAGNYDISINISDLSASDKYVILNDKGTWGSQANDQLIILDVSNPSVPKKVGSYGGIDEPLMKFFVKNNYAYLVFRSTQFHILDISDPTSPTLTGRCNCSFSSPSDVVVYKNFAYIVNYENGLKILDVTDPTTPVLAGTYNMDKGANSIHFSGNVAYVGKAEWGYDSDTSNGEFHVLNISNPASPQFVGMYQFAPGTGKPSDLKVSGNYIYASNSIKGLSILNISNPSYPYTASSLTLQGSNFSNITINDNYAYIADNENGLQVVDVSKVLSPVLAGNFKFPSGGYGIANQGDYTYTASCGKLFLLRSNETTEPPKLQLSRKTFFFAVDDAGTTSPSQSFFITNTGEGLLEWTAVSDSSWLNCSPTFGSGDNRVTLSISVSSFSPGTYTGTVTVAAPGADNSPQIVTVFLNVHSPGQTVPPFGVFATPTDGSVVYSNVPVTGWALDDIAVESVKIYREAGESLIYIGEAIMVEGARPDVEVAYPNYPNNHRAGWGYMMLTNFLPTGNGVFRIHAIAKDIEGNQVTLGVKTIIVDNANAVKPFGTIDTPPQGGIISGDKYINFGWALTPQPNIIPFDGSTIRVWVDGVHLSNPVYNVYRKDIAGLFPNYNNTDGAVGYFYLDTTQYANGLHTIAWSAEDDAGNRDGIGSRFFTIANIDANGMAYTPGVQKTGTRNSATNWNTLTINAEEYFHDRKIFIYDNEISDIPKDYINKILIKKGFIVSQIPSGTNEWETVYPNRNDLIELEIRETQRIEIILNPCDDIDERSNSNYYGYHEVGLRLKNLPVGSFMDPKNGVFYWQPGPGFVGDYRFVFIRKDENGNKSQKKILIRIK